MIKICIDRNKTYDDYELSTEYGFPLVYIGRGSYTGNVCLNTYHSLAASEEVHLIYIGRYTSIGDNIRIYCDINHDYKSIYMGVIPEYADPSDNADYRAKIGQMTKRMIHKGMIIIGNDVWIGNDVTIISDVTIGNGAVIGAGSVVTKDIPPYTIWCGNPATLVGNRFSSDIIQGLQQISWWNYDKNQLKSIESDMKGDPASFVEKYRPIVENLSESQIIPKCNLPIMVTFIDNNTNYPVYGNILEQFITKFNNRNGNLYLCYYRDKDNDLKTIDALSGIFTKLKDRVNLFPLEIGDSDDEQVIKDADYLILGRDNKYLQRINYAFKHNVKCLSGVNNPIFYDSLF